MSEFFTRGLAAATALTKAGKLKDATALLQRVLRSTQPTAGPASEQPNVGRLRDITPLDPARATTSPVKIRDLFKKANSATGVMPATGQFAAGSYISGAGSRGYKLYTPTRRRGGARPLVIMLHGCTQSAEDFAAGTRMNLRAEEHECFVLYPEQTVSANAQKCWNWFQSSHQGRDAGEPALIAGMTREIMAKCAIDPGRVYIAGLSAGGAAAAIMAEAYADLYRAVGVHSGLACGAASDMPSAFAAMSGYSKPRNGAQPRAAGAFVPTIVFHGDSDTTVHPRNGTDVVARAGEFSNLKPTIESGNAGGRSYARTLYRDKRGRTVMEDWVLHGAGHAWSGGSNAGSFTDASGPDASHEMLRFFLSQPA